MSVMDVEYQNACFKVEHDLFCTNQPSLSRVRCTDVLSQVRNFADMVVWLNQFV